MKDRSFLHILLLLIASVHLLWGGEKNSSSNASCEFQITAAQRSKPTEREIRDFPDIIAKWIVSTKFTNTSGQPQLLLRVPYYGGAEGDDRDSTEFQSGSRLPVKSKDHDFLTLMPGGSIEAKHAVLAVRDSSGLRFTVFGSFQESVNCPEVWKENNFPINWTLTKPVTSEFELSITLTDRLPSGARAMLGTNVENLWRGYAITKPTKLRVVEPDRKH